MSAAAAAVGPASVGAARLAAQHVTASHLTTVDAVVAHLGAVQAQDLLACRWAIGARLAASAERDVVAAMERGDVIRIHALRGTWQLVARDDVRWLLSLVAPTVLDGARRRHAELGIDLATRRSAARVVERALRGRAELTRAELADALERGGVSTEGQRLSHLLSILELEGALASGPMRAKHTTWSAFDARVPPSRSRPRDEAAVALAQRYVNSRAPATADDFVWWSGLPRQEARAAFASVRAPTPPALASGKPRAHLLPAFDELLVGYRDRDAVLDPAHVKRINAGGGILSPILVIDGHVRGTWSRTVRAKRVKVEPAWFARPSAKDARDVSEAAERYARFLGLALEA